MNVTPVTACSSASPARAPTGSCSTSDTGVPRKDLAMGSTLRTPAPPSPHLDPFDHDSLEDPAPLHTALRDAGPVVYLNRYDVYAMARYEQVHAALTDWQGF